MSRHVKRNGGVRVLETARNDIFKVTLDGSFVGQIRKAADGLVGWQYFPKGETTGGEVLPTVEAVERSLRGMDEAPHEIV